MKLNPEAKEFVPINSSVSFHDNAVNNGVNQYPLIHSRPNQNVLTEHISNNSSLFATNQRADIYGYSINNNSAYNNYNNYNYNTNISSLIASAQPLAVQNMVRFF